MFNYERTMVFLTKLVCAHFYLEQEFKSYLQGKMRWDGLGDVMQLLVTKLVIKFKITDADQ